MPIKQPKKQPPPQKKEKTSTQLVLEIAQRELKRLERKKALDDDDIKQLASLAAIIQRHKDHMLQKQLKQTNVLEKLSDEELSKIAGVIK